MLMTFPIYSDDLIEVHESAFEMIQRSETPIQHVAAAARTCYQSEGKLMADIKLIRNLIRRGHESMLEFAHLGFRIQTDRGVTHELVRHRVASFAQESTRYCNYGGGRIKFIKPATISIDTDQWKLWLQAMTDCAINYNKMLELGANAGLARSVLPNSLKTEICINANLREWRHIFKLRCVRTAHPDMVNIMWKLLNYIRNVNEFALFFEDIEV